MLDAIVPPPAVPAIPGVKPTGPYSTTWSPAPVQLISADVEESTDAAKEVAATQGGGAEQTTE